MPLDVELLTGSLRDILSGAAAAKDAPAAGKAWADAYAAFAAGGAANAVAPAIAPAITAALATTLGTAFTDPGTPATAALGIATGLDLFWPGAVFAGQASPAAPTGGVTLLAELTDIFIAVGGTHASKAGEIAGALLRYTVAVAVVFPGGVTFPVA